MGGRKVRLRLGKGNKNGVFLILTLALRFFGSAQVRLRLGNERKSELFLYISLALH